MNDEHRSLLSVLAGEPFDESDISATLGWFECGCGTEWWIDTAGDADATVGRDTPCRICADRTMRRALHTYALESTS